MHDNKLILFQKFSLLFTKHFRILYRCLYEKRKPTLPFPRRLNRIEWRQRIEKKLKEEPSNTFYSWFIAMNAIQNSKRITLYRCGCAVSKSMTRSINWMGCVFHFDLIWVVEITFTIQLSIESKWIQPRSRFHIQNISYFPKIKSELWICYECHRHLDHFQNEIKFVHSLNSHSQLFTRLFYFRVSFQFVFVYSSFVFTKMFWF